MQKHLCILILLLSAPAIANHKGRPQCASRQGTHCSILAGSTDVSGFLVVDSGRQSASADSQIATVNFYRERTNAPVCELRRNGTEPKIITKTSIYSMQIFLIDSTKLPKTMRWFYVCRVPSVPRSVSSSADFDLVSDNGIPIVRCGLCVDHAVTAQTNGRLDRQWCRIRTQRIP